MSVSVSMCVSDRLLLHVGRARRADEAFVGCWWLGGRGAGLPELRCLLSLKSELEEAGGPLVKGGGWRTKDEVERSVR